MMQRNLPCPTCDGSGWPEEIGLLGDPCPECDGYGVVDPDSDDEDEIGADAPDRPLHPRHGGAR